ncbi:MAG: transposase family protein [Chloroflexi bacterium]|nr:transposase family protein [Chloroflexota bacterium]
MITVMAKLCGEDTPSTITDWGQNHAAQIVAWLQLEHSAIPNYNTYWRIMAHQDEIEK